jgi:hypothetical protein
VVQFDDEPAPSFFDDVDADAEAAADADSPI